MQYRKLGRTGLDVGVIGLGTEHLARDPQTMDTVLAAAVEAGVNYVDMLYADPKGTDASFWEAFGPALRIHRPKMVVAAHFGSGETWPVDRCQRCFDDVLNETGNGYADIGLMTMVDDDAKWNSWAQEAIPILQRYKAQGRIGHIGLSSHVPWVARKIVESGLIDVLMYNVNMVSAGNPPDDAVLQACADRGVGLVVMKVYHGSTLLAIKGQPTGITPAQCMDYVLSRPEVSTTVPGPHTLAEWQTTLRYLAATPAERDFRPVLAGLKERLAGQCVYCHHCLPCPEGVEIAWAIWFLDQAWHGWTPELQGGYNSFRARASACTECGDCLSRCPFGVDIFSRLRESAVLFERSVA